MSEIQLGLGSKNYGQVETSELKGGIRREQLKTDEQKSIFDAVDVDKNGILDESEVQKFTEKLEDAAGNEKLSKREAKKFLKEQNLKNIDKEELFNFVNGLKENSENITDSKVIENENGEKTILVTYKDGSQETINPDRTSQLVSTNQNNAVTTKFFDENRKLTKEQVVEENGDSTVTDIVDGLPVKKTSVENNGTKTSVVEYENGKEVHKKVTEGTKESEYQYVDGKPVLSRKVEDLGNDIKRTTDYTYNQDGTVTEKITEPDKYNVRQVKDGKVLSEVITDSQNRKTERLYRDDNITQEVVTDGENKTATLYNTETGKRLQQAKLVNGQQYAIEYDGNGNTKGIIVQNGESISDIAKKFGCSEKQLKEVNKDILKGKNYFDVGAEIKIPREIEADAKVLQGRKPAEIAKAEYARDAEIRRQKAKAAAEEKAYYQKLGVKSFNNKGKKVKADGWGNKEFEIVGQLGYARQLVKRDGKLYTMSHDNKILREDYLEAHRAFVSKAKNQRNNTASGIKDVTYVKDSNGKVWYFDEKTGKAIIKGGYTKIVKEESAFISNQLYKAAKGAGTDEELLKKGVNNIYSRDILKGVNAELKTKSSDYAGDAQTMPVEALILDEMSHGAARPVFKALIDSGTMTVEEQAHTIKREIEHEVHGGILGYTSTSDLNEVMQLTDNRDVRLEIEAQFKKDYPELKENEGSVVRQYIAEDGWNAQEVDQFDANWVKTGAYSEAKYVYQTNEKGEIVLDKNGKPVVVLDEGDQAHRNGVIGRLVFDYKDKEALNKGLEAVNDNPNSFDYQYLDSRAGEEIAKDPNGKYQSRFTDQDNIQRYLAGFHTDENGAVDAGNVSASNTCLFKGLKPARVQAEEALYKAQQGDYSQTFDSMDTETYSEIANLVANGDVKGVKNMTDLYNKAINSAKDVNSKTKIKANAMISGQIEFSDKEITDFCVELMHSIDTNRGQGGSTGVSAKYTNSANEQTEQLKAILQNNPQVMDAVKARVEKEDFSYTTTTQTGGGSASMPTTTMHTTNTKDVYRQLLADTKNVVSESVFYDSEGNKITDPQQIEALKEANMQALGEMRNYVAELEREFKKGVDAEGWLSDAANGLSTYSGLGTDRDDVATEYKNAKVTLSQLEAAAQGRLRDSKGNVVSVQDLAKQVVDKQNSLATTNSDYKQTIAYGKMGIVLAPVMVVTTVASGGAAAAGWGTLATAAVGGVAAGATTYGVNAIEYNTSYTGNTAEAREQNLEDSLVNGVTTAIGIGQMKYIAGMANNMGTVARTGVRLATTVAADTGAGALSEYATTGDIATDGTMSNMIMSGVGNVIGAKSLGKKVSAASASHSRPDVSFNKKRAIEDVDVEPNAMTSNLSVNESHIVPDGSSGVPANKEYNAAANNHITPDSNPVETKSVVSEPETIDTPIEAQKSVEPEVKPNEQSVVADSKPETMDKPLEAQKTVEPEVKPKEQSVNSDSKIEAMDDAVASTSNKNNASSEIPKVNESDAKNIMQKVASIKDADIPSALSSKWSDCKVKISELTQKCQNAVANGKDVLIADCKALFTELSVIAKQCSAAGKAQISEIVADIKAMVKKALAGIQSAADNVLNSSSSKSATSAPQITPKQNMEMGQIGNSISMAKSVKELKSLQTWLDKMPDCSKKTVLQNQINAKISKLNAADAHTVKAHDSYSSNPIYSKSSKPQPVGNSKIAPFVDLGYPKITTKYGVQNLVKGQKYQVDIAKNQKTQISMGFGVTQLDIKDKLFMSKFKALKEGESFTVGSWEGNADYKIGSMETGVSREHFTVIKENGQMVIIDKKSTNGTRIQANNPAPVSVADIKAYFSNDIIDPSLSAVNPKMNLHLDDVDYANIEKLMNVCGGKYINVWFSTCGTDGVKNIDKLALLEKVLRKNNAVDLYLKLGPNEWDLVCNTTCQKYADAVTALSNYKKNSNPMNLYLSGLKSPEAMAYFNSKWSHLDKNELAQEITQLTNFLDKQRINKKLWLHRGDSYKGVNYLTTSTGEPLGQAMENLIKYGASEAEIKAFVAQNLQGKSILQERFMSTTLTEEVATKWAKADVCGNGFNPNGAIRWDISASAGTKGAHCEDFTPYNTVENEVLLQRGTSLDIMDAYFDRQNNIWVIKAIARQV